MKQYYCIMVPRQVPICGFSSVESAERYKTERAVAGNNQTVRHNIDGVSRRGFRRICPRARAADEVTGMRTTTNTCPQNAAFQAIVWHVESCTHCGRKWAGLRKDQPYCAEYLDPARWHNDAACTCGDMYDASTCNRTARNDARRDQIAVS